MTRVLFFSLLLLALALPAGAQSLEGGCTVTATSDVDQTTVVDATQSDPFDIDPEGSVSWDAKSPGPITNHQWSIAVRLGLLPVTVASGGDPNGDEKTESSGSRSIPGIIEELKARGTPGANLLEGISGKFLVSGEISGDGGACSGSAYVRILGDPLSSPIGQGAAALTGVGALLTLIAAVARKP